MKRTCSLGLLAAGLLWLVCALAAQSSVPIDDPLRVDFPPNAGFADAVVGEKIKQVAAARSWRVDSERPGRIALSTTFNNKHRVSVEVEYAGSGYTLRYIESFNLRYRADSRTIHPNYNAWMRDLCSAINSTLGVTAMASVPLTIPGAAAPASAAPAAAAAASSGPRAEGIPAPGSKWRYGYRDRQYVRGERFFTVEVAGVEQATVRERVAVEGGNVSESIIDANKFAFAVRPFVSGSSVVELTPYLRDMQNRPSQPPAGYPGAAGARWNISAPEYAEEEVRVPAGNFKALRVEVRGSLETPGGPPDVTARFVYVAWYSRELGRCVRIQHQTWNRQNARTSDEQVQLVAFQTAK